MTKREKIIREWFALLSPEEKAIALRSWRETKQFMRERIPQPVVFSYGTSTPWYKATLMTEARV